MYRSRHNYWSLSPLAKWIRKKAGLTNPGSLTLEGWDEHHKECKEKAPFVYWLTETAFDEIQDVVMYPIDVFKAIKYFLHCWKNNTHVLDGGLKIGVWHSFESKLLPCLFGELVKAVELQGLEHLEWEKTLVYNEEWGYEEGHPLLGQPTEQALEAMEKEKLYKWWKEDYPNRADPYEISGMKDYYEKCGADSDGWFIFSTTEDDSWQELNDKCIQIEKQYQQEDYRMLIRLINIRRSV